MKRRREVVSASDLLRICMAYGFCDMSLRQVAAWASATGLGQLSNVAVLKRLRACSDWLGYIVSRWLIERGLTTSLPPYQVRIIDATLVNQPGTEGVDWRVHLGYDIGRQKMTEIEVADKSQAETLERHRVNPDEVILADRGYAHPSAIAHLLEKKGHIIIRFCWATMPLYTAEGKKIDFIPLLQTLSPNEVGDWQVYLHHNGKVYPMRVVAIKKTEEATERERWKLRQRARMKKHKVDYRSLIAAGYIYLLTDFPAEKVGALEVLEMYRLRWQIEIAFKRLKSLLNLDGLRAKDPALARTYILSKIIGALVIEEMSGAALSFFPWGFRLPGEAGKPLACYGSVE